MLRCLNAACTFWVHFHHYRGEPLADGEPCPLCGKPLAQMAPEKPPIPDTRQWVFNEGGVAEPVVRPCGGCGK